MTSNRFDMGTAIFYFFNRFGERPGGAMWIVFWQLAVVALLTVAAFWLLTPVFAALFEMIALEDAGGLTDEEALSHVLRILGPSFGLMALAVPVGIVISLMFEGAWLRFLTRGEIKPVIPFRLGGDELRLLGVNLLLIAAGVGLYIVAAILMILFSAGAAGLVSAGDGSIGAGMGAGLVVFLGVLLLIAVTVFVAIKLATAPALTVLDGRFRFFESATAAKGVFWHLLLTYIVVALLILVVSMVVGTVVQIVAFGAFLPLIEQIVALDNRGGDVTADEIFALFGDVLSQPAVLGVLIVGGAVAYIGQIVYEAMWHSVGAYNAVRYRAGGVEETDAPALASGHPMGASPAEG